MAFPSSSFTSSIHSDSIDPLLSDYTPSRVFTISEAPESQSTELITSLSLPSSLQRISGGKKEYALWTVMNKTEFINWWLTTQYATTSPHAKRVRWDKQGQTAKIWSYFDQVANIQDGTPMVTCKRCDTILTHPVQNGTTGMGKHHHSSACKTKRHQGNIEQLIKRVVSKRKVRGK